MPPFGSIPFVPIPYAGGQGTTRLADLIRQSGQDRANAAQNSGAIQAYMWGNLGRNINDAVGNVLQAQAQAPIIEANKLKVAQAKDAAAGKQQLQGLMQGGPHEMGPQLPEDNPYLQQEGDISVWNVDKLSKSMAASGHGLSPDLISDVGKLNDLHRSEYKARQEQQTLQQQIISHSAGTVLTAIEDHGMDPVEGVSWIGSQLKANKTFPQGQVQQQLGDLLSDPSTIVQKLHMMRDLGQKPKEPIKLTEGEQLRSGEDPSKVLAENPKVALVPQVNPETERHNKELERISGLTAGRADAAAKETERHNRAMEARPVAGAASSGSVLSDTAVDQAAQRYLATGELPPGMGVAAVNQRTAVMNRAALLNPDAAIARNKAVYKADSTNLTNLQRTEGTLSAFENTAGKNLDQFLELAKNIPDTGIPWINRPVRTLTKEVVGEANIAAINAARDVALREIARVTNDPKLSGQLTDSARKEIASLSPDNATLPQIRAVVKVLKQDMANVHAGLTQQIATVKASIGGNPNPDTPSDDLYQQYLKR